MKINVTYDTEMKGNFSDLRFTDSGATTELSYWIESYVASTSAVVWLKVPSIPASSNKTIYMYYGNVSATSSSNGDNTFEFFDDFNFKDASKWNWPSDWNVVGGQAKDANTTDWGAGLGTKYLYLPISSVGYSVSFKEQTNPGIWNWDFNIGVVINNNWYGTNILKDYYGCNFFFRLDGGCGINERIHLDTRNWHTYNIVVKSNSQEIYVDGTASWQSRWKTYSLLNNNLNKIVLNPKGGGYLDDIYIRKYASPEP